MFRLLNNSTFFTRIFRKKRLFWAFLLAIFCVVSVPALSWSQPRPDISPASPPSSYSWPGAQVHPLPASLAKANNPNSSGDYFDQVLPSSSGYLVWSRFPVTVYIAPASAVLPFQSSQLQAWQQAARQAVKDWKEYIPLQVIERPELADITILPNPPATAANQRVRAGETSFNLFVDSEGILRHRMLMLIRPNQPANYALATIRHEFGHALGIWGHSPQPQDVMFFSQVVSPPKISAQDINTLRRIYQQPTKLGWKAS
jgi:predicted Zn-dependent protease